jgi:hypothetical protein
MGVFCWIRRVLRPVGLIRHGLVAPHVSLL